MLGTHVYFYRYDNKGVRTPQAVVADQVLKDGLWGHKLGMIRLEMPQEAHGKQWGSDQLSQWAYQLGQRRTMIPVLGIRKYDLDVCKGIYDQVKDATRGRCRLLPQIGNEPQHAWGNDEWYSYAQKVYSLAEYVKDRGDAVIMASIGSFTGAGTTAKHARLLQREHWSRWLWALRVAGYDRDGDYIGSNSYTFRADASQGSLRDNVKIAKAGAELLGGRLALTEIGWQPNQLTPGQDRKPVILETLRWAQQYSSLVCLWGLGVGDAYDIMPLLVPPAEIAKDAVD